MRFLLEAPVDGDLDEITAAARAAHANGVDGVLIRRSRWSPDPLVVVAAVAARVAEIRIAAEIELGEQHPFEVAENVAVTDLTTGGRLILVVRPAGALGDYAEALDLLRTALTPRPFRFEGARWRVPANLPENEFGQERLVRLTPAPAQPSVPVWGTGAGRGPALERGLGHLADEDDPADELGAAHARAASSLGPAAIGAPRARRETLGDGPEALVARLLAGREQFGQDWAVVAGGGDEAAVIGRQVRPRVQLEHLHPSLVALWEPDAG
ncbi:MAG TPA: LLM class flavin-dependent oxidoreductase [Solirubrobacteraceae bacterium]|nr:LLM class flavin-dependent oxidoreductase [Solirubrobacteraceae bacterium]